MTEYTSTREGFQRLIEWSLTGPASETQKYVDATAVPSFYQIMNGNRLEYDAWFKSLEEWRGKISEYKPKIEEFLRDGDQLAAHMTGTIKIDGVETFFESFLFAKVDEETGKLAHLIERAVWGAVGKVAEHGVN